MDYMKGVRICDIQAIKSMGVDLAEVAYKLSKVFNEMIFVHGFVHCDPHPGNIFVDYRIDGSINRPVIVLLDHGLYRELAPEKLKSYSSLWRAILNRDEENIKLHAAELGVFSLYPLLAGMMVGRTWDEIMDDDAGLERLKNPRASQTDKAAIRLHAQQWRSEINQVLSRMDNEIILLFKTFEWLRANDAALGAPINTIEIISEYVNKKESNWKKTLIKLKLWLYKKLTK
jgi:aarF domain-containing kinase